MEVKNKRKKKMSNVVVVAVAYKRWALTRGSIHSDLASKNFWYFGKVVPYERWSQREVRLY